MYHEYTEAIQTQLQCRHGEVRLVNGSVLMREEWKSVMILTGVQFVIMAGQIMMLQLYADSLATIYLVGKFIVHLCLAIL